MPELPEVETIVRDVRPRLIGRRLVRVRLSHDDVLRGVTRRRLLAGLRGARVVSVTRRAKHAILRFDSGRRLIVQPGMTGTLLATDGALTRDEGRYAVLQAALEPAGTLAYRDVRRIGTLRLVDAAAWQRYEAALGPEPLAPSFTATRLAAILSGSTQYVKKVLMDQRRLAGVGNIYAQEALFAAGIDPSRPARALSPVAVSALHRALRHILRAAILANGTTIRDYRRGTGDRGGFQLELMVYGREGEPCRRCGTSLAGTHALDGRITVFCHRCQG